MQILSCAGCGADLEDGAAYCPDCGLVPVAGGPGLAREAVPVPAIAPAAASAPPAAPSAPSSPRAVRNLRFAQGAAVLVCLAAGSAVAVFRSDLDPNLVHAGQVGDWGTYISTCLGSAVQSSFGALIGSLCLLGWWKKTRRWVPFLAAVVMLGKAAGRRDERVVRDTAYGDVVAALVQTRQAALDYAPPDTLTVMPVPDGVYARVEWAEHRYLVLLAAYERSTITRTGFTVTDPPAAWTNGTYVADPLAHPEVRRYWLEREKAAGEVGELLTRYGEFARHHVEYVSGLPSDSDAWRAERLRAFGLIAGPYQRQAALARAALGLYETTRVLHIDHNRFDLGRIRVTTDSARLDSRFWEARRRAERECDQAAPTCAATPVPASP
jgi:hypothetical protein